VAGSTGPINFSLSGNFLLVEKLSSKNAKQNLGLGSKFSEIVGKKLQL